MLLMLCSQLQYCCSCILEKAFKLLKVATSKSCFWIMVAASVQVNTSEGCCWKMVAASASFSASNVAADKSILKSLSALICCCVIWLLLLHPSAASESDYYILSCNNKYVLTPTNKKHNCYVYPNQYSGCLFQYRHICSSLQSIPTTNLSAQLF